MDISVNERDYNECKEYIDLIKKIKIEKNILLEQEIELLKWCYTFLNNNKNTDHTNFNLLLDLISYKLKKYNKTIIYWRVKEDLIKVYRFLMYPFII